MIQYHSKKGGTMTYNINKELLEIANNKDAFKFDLKKYKASTLQELESYKSADEAKSLANIAINTILLVGNNKGFETIEKQVKATAVKNKNTEIAELEKVLGNIQNTLENDIFTKANVRVILRATGSLMELQNKNFRQELAAQIKARLAEMK